MMRRMHRIPKTLQLSILVLLLIFTAFQIAAQQTWRVDDRVLAEWANSAWYAGKIASSCDDGYQVLYDDGDTKCAAVHEIIADDAPDSNDVEVGTLVLAAWGSAYYPAKVTTIDGSEYSVEYFDGDEGTLDLGQLRVLTGAIARKNDFNPSADTGGSSSESGPGSESGSTDSEMVLSEEMQIWRGGARWATIEINGNIWIGGSRVGEIESDGEVWIGGSNDGEIESDGDIWFRGSDAGDIESNGKLWRGGSRIAEIEPDGDIYLNGSWWGEAEPFNGSYEELRVIAATLAFFSVDFGFYE